MSDPYTPEAFLNLGVESVAYARAGVISNKDVIAAPYVAIFDATGIQLAVAPNMDQAAYMARSHDLELQYIH